jgi:hypothetical protein
LWFKKGFCWNLIDATGRKSFRLVDDESIFNLAAPTLFPNSDDELYYLMGLLNTKISNLLMQVFNPTLNNNLIDIIRKKVLNGTPYIGWSAGSNVACPTIKTTGS